MHPRVLPSFPTRRSSDLMGGEYPGTLGPELVDIKSKYPNRDELVAIVYDETKRNPLTVMPPFGRNRILTDKEISAVVDRKSTRLNSSHRTISYAVFCLKN